jgi:hypothetical protein
MYRIRRSSPACGVAPRTLMVLLAAVVVAACTDANSPSLAGPEAQVEGTLDAQGQASKRTFTAHLEGAQEVPPVDTQARGQAIFQVSRDGTEISYRLIVANIENVTQAHIHVGEAGVNGPVVAWLYPSGPPAELIPGRSSGVLATGVITAESLVGPWAGEPLNTLIAAMRSEGVYVNVHTSQFPPGEVRGQIR